MSIPLKWLGSALIAAVVGVVGASPAAWAQAKELKTVNVLLANERTCTFYEAFAAKDLGFFEKEGLDVNLLASATTIPYVAFLSNGDADLAMLDSAQVLQAVNSGQPISVVYEAMQFAPEGIYVTADSEIKDMKDLKGKTVGLASDRDQITTVIALDSVGMTIDDVKTVVVGDSGPLLASSLTNKTIDAFAGSVSDLAAIEANGVEVRNITPPAVSENPGNSFAIWKPTEEEKKDIIEGFLRAWAKANNAGVLDAKVAGSICKVNVPEQWEVHSVGLDLLNNAVYSTNLARTKNRGEPQPDVWARIQEPYQKLGEISKQYDPKTFTDMSFIEPANDYTTDEVKAAIADWKEKNADKMIP